MTTLLQLASRIVTEGGIVFMRLLALLPLGLVRLLGRALGWVLYALVGTRRRVVTANLTLCFPELSAPVIQRLALQTFVFFAQAWLDRSWIWHAPASWVKRRISLNGAVNELQGAAPTVIFLPHFVGLDAAWAGVALRVPRPSTTIYTDQSNRLVDRWILRGRRRFGNLRLFGRSDGVKPIVTAIKAGEPLYLLPDMDFGPNDSVFVPFYGIPTATVPSLARFARLGGAKVVPIIAQMTSTGYVVRVHSAWQNFPTGDAVADTAFMNQQLQGYINMHPAQYYWVHRRFKTRPVGMPDVYCTTDS